MECPKCKSRNYVKDGIVKKRQRYLCKECKYRYTVEQRGIPNATKTLAIQMYLEGLGFRSIERILKVSNVSVLNWVKALGKQVEEYRKPVKNIEIIELDELKSKMGKKDLGNQVVALQGLVIKYQKASIVTLLGIQEERDRIGELWEGLIKEVVATREALKEAKAVVRGVREKRVKEKFY